MHHYPHTIFQSMLYELIGIARATNKKNIHADAKEVVRTIGKLLIQNRGVVRKINSLGLRKLPKIMVKSQEKHYQGSQFMILFDSSAAVQSQVLHSLRNDPRVIRSNVVRVDDSRGSLNVLSSIEKIRQ